MVVRMREPITVRTLAANLSILVLLLTTSLGNYPIALLAIDEKVYARVEMPGLTGSSHMERSREENLTEGDEIGGSWYQTYNTDFNLNSSESHNVNVTGTGADAELILSDNSLGGYYLSPIICLPNKMYWSFFSIDKDEPVNTSLNVSFLDPETNMTVPGFENLTESYFDISNLNTQCIALIRIRGAFHGGENITPVLDSWGVEWSMENAWRDSFTGESRLVSSTGCHFVNRSVRLLPNEIPMIANTTASWHMDEGGGSIVHDSSGKGNNGTLHNMGGGGWKAGVRGGGLSFDGVDDYVNIDTVTNDLHDTDSATVSLFVYVNYWNPSDETILEIGNSAQSDKILIRNQAGNLLFYVTSNSIGTCALYIPYPSSQRWHHLAFTVRDNDFQVYVDGIIAANSSSGNASRFAYIDSANIGAEHELQQGSFFKGVIDEVSIYNRSLDGTEILELCESGNHFIGNGTLVSDVITLPVNSTWEDLRFSRTVSDNTYLNITIHDANTRETLFSDSTNAGDPNNDVSVMDSILHPSIYLQAYFESNRTGTPILYHWGLNWSPVRPPILVCEIGDIEVTEDTPRDNILDLSTCFYDPYSFMGPTNYTLDIGNNSGNVTVELNGTNISVTDMADNWTGAVSLIVNCTNVFKLTTTSNQFRITVINVNDRPVWTSQPPDIVMSENTIHISNYSLEDFGFDADGDDLEFFITSSDENITVELDENHSIVIRPPANYSGKGVLNLTVGETSGDRLSANIYVNFIIEPVNDPPVALLIFPVDRSVLTSLNATLVWTVLDLDSPLSDIRFDLYFGTNSTPGLAESNIKGTSWTFEGLADGGTYYWYVIPSDGETTGRCKSGIREFSLNTTISIPYVTLSSPLDGFFFNDTEMKLKWSLSETIEEEMRFYLFYGVSPRNLELLWETDMTEYHLSVPGENNTFYWYVIPASGRILGQCPSGLWEFSYVKNFVPVFSVVSSLDVNDLIIRSGENRTFNLTINNTGNNPMLVEIETQGSLAKYVTFQKTVHLDKGASTRLPVTIRTGDSLPISELELTILIKHPGGTEEMKLHVTVEDGDDGGEKDSKDEKTMGIDWLWLTMDIIVALVLMIGIVLVIRKRRKRALVVRDEENEETEQKGGNVYVVGGFKDDHGDDPGIPDIMPDHFDTSPTLGEGSVESPSGIRPPKWLTGSEPYYLNEQGFGAYEDPEEDLLYTDNTHIFEPERGEEQDEGDDIREYISSSSWQDQEGEATPRPPRWMARKKRKEEINVLPEGSLGEEDGDDDPSEPEKETSVYEFLSPEHFFSDDDDADDS